MTALESLKELDWDAAIAAATQVIDSNPATGSKPPCAYLYRGIARCFTENKDGKHSEAIEDLSVAIAKANVCHSSSACTGDDKCKKINGEQCDDLNKSIINEQVYYYRAFAYYLDGNYERAIADCKKVKTREGKELLGKIYFDMGEHRIASNCFGKAMKGSGLSAPVSPGLLCEYMDACKRMNKG